MLPIRFFSTGRKTPEPVAHEKGRAPAGPQIPRQPSPGTDWAKAGEAGASLFKREKSRESAKNAERAFFGEAAYAGDESAAKEPSLRPKEGVKSRLAGLVRAKSDNNLQARRVAERDACSGVDAPALPPLRIDPHTASLGLASPDNATRQPASPHTPRAPVTFTAAQQTAVRPMPPTRATTSDIAQQSYDRSKVFPFPGPPPKMPQAIVNRASSASSSFQTLSTADSRSTLVTSPSLSSVDGRSSISELSFASAAASRKPNPRLRRAFDAQAAFAQDNLLYKMKLNAISVDANRPRRMSHALLGGLPAELMPILSRCLYLSPEATARLKSFQQMLWQTRDAHRCNSESLESQVALRDSLFRIREAAKAEANRLPRRPYENYANNSESERMDSALRAQAEMIATERLENDLVRFLYEAIDLRDVLSFQGHEISPEVRDKLRQSSRAFPAKEMERILLALNLKPQQRHDLQRYVEQCKQVEGLLRPMASNDSMRMSERGHPGSP